MSNAMSLKAKIRNIAKKKNIPAQVILQNYMFERLLVRLSVSDYREKFVLKGGMLVAAIVGLDNRATMDLDTTLKNLPLSRTVPIISRRKLAGLPSSTRLRRSSMLRLIRHCTALPPVASSFADASWRGHCLFICELHMIYVELTLSYG